MKQPDIVLIKATVDQLFPDLEIPKGVHNERPFYEGLLACEQTFGRRSLTTNPYKKFTDRHADWETGWTTSLKENDLKEQAAGRPGFIKSLIPVGVGV